MQLALDFAVEPSNNGPDNGGFRDPAFMANRGVPVHRWVPWIAGYSQQFVEDALNRHMGGFGTVLDPFAGVGTTLVEADLAGHDAVGFEINPYAAFVCQTKLKAHRINTECLDAAIPEFRTFVKQAESGIGEPETSPPVGFRTRVPFYSPKVLRKVLFCLDFIKDQEQRDVADVFRVAFAATMVDYSNYSYEPSLGRKSAVGRPDVDDFPVMETIAGKVAQMVDDARWYRIARNRPGREDGSVVNGSFLEEYSRIGPQSVDLLVTSPPYLNNYHYNRNTRPHLYWLDLCRCPDDMKPLETLNFGTYWQNARDQDQIHLDSVIQDDEIHDVIEEIRTRNPDKGVYGGAGWANYATLYFNDCVRFVTGAKWCLRSGATSLVVIGNSILQGVPVPTDQFLSKIADAHGMETVAIHVPRNTRVGSSIVGSAVRVGKTGKGSRLYESVVELRKP